MMQESNNNMVQMDYEEDEIDLRELFATIWRHKVKIALFSSIVTLFIIIYTLSIPNSYKSQTILIPQTQSKPSLGGLGALVGMAGVDIGGSGDVDIGLSLTTILKDHSFEEYIIKKYNLTERLLLRDENLVFPFGYDGIYRMRKSDKEESSDSSEEENIFNTYKKIVDMISISSDKKSGMITLSVEAHDRFLAKELVEIYLDELTAKLRDIEMQSVEQQIKYYNQELTDTIDINIKTQLGQLIAGLVQKKVLSMANRYYNVKQLTKPQVSYVKDKSKPKRGLIVVVSFITSIILAIFGIFFLEFLRNEDEEVGDNE